ncbi:hypothetical protein QR680_010834 [Steinernema hermaphroditum]|uniref:Mannose-6-phosphate isomerase n=1 Tax=Steinernema hermaphroditum TaxID=289476 RepID=A0AA39IRR5_9BILA|nr:hypothetical protein QR680_010834 [Steinernema hermaphroditum]
MFLLLLTFLHLLQTAHGLLCHKFMYDTHKGFQTNVTVERSLSDDPYCISFHDSQQNQMFFGPQDSHDFCQPGSSTSSEVAFSSCNRCNWDFCDLEYMPESVRNVAKKASDGPLWEPYLKVIPLEARPLLADASIQIHPSKGADSILSRGASLMCFHQIPLIVEMAFLAQAFSIRFTLKTYPLWQGSTRMIRFL